MNQHMKIFFILMSIFSSGLVQAGVIQDVNFSDGLNVQGKNLILNGLGVRTKKIVFVKVKVYAAGLYLESRSNDRNAILTDRKIKRLDMHFLHDVSKDKLIQAWSEAFESNCEPSVMDCKQVATLMAKIKPFADDLKVGDRISITFLPEDVVMKFKDQAERVISGGTGFSKIMLSAWLGKNPPDEDLQKGLLGQR